MDQRARDERMDKERRASLARVVKAAWSRTKAARDAAAAQRSQEEQTAREREQGAVPGPRLDLHPLAAAVAGAGAGAEACGAAAAGGGQHRRDNRPAWMQAAGLQPGDAVTCEGTDAKRARVESSSVLSAAPVLSASAATASASEPVRAAGFGLSLGGGGGAGGRATAARPNPLGLFAEEQQAARRLVTLDGGGGGAEVRPEARAAAGPAAGETEAARDQRIADGLPATTAALFA